MSSPVTPTTLTAPSGPLTNPSSEKQSKQPKKQASEKQLGGSSSRPGDSASAPPSRRLSNASDSQGAAGDAKKYPTTKAERRAVQEAQRAAKALAKGQTPAPATEKKPPSSGKPPVVPQNPAAAGTLDKNQAASGGASGAIRQDGATTKQRPQVPATVRHDDPKKMAKTMRNNVATRTPIQNTVLLFSHVAQYQRDDAHLRDLQEPLLHPAFLELATLYLHKRIAGANARAVAFLNATRQFIRDYKTPQDVSLARHMELALSKNLTYLGQIRPNSTSMGSAIRALKLEISSVPPDMHEDEAKEKLFEFLDDFINQRIVVASRETANKAAEKIDDGEVILTFGRSSLVESSIMAAWEKGKRFRVVIVDSRPNFEGKELLRRLVAKQVPCTYILINAVSYIMKEVTKVLLGAASVLHNGNVMARCGTALVCMAAHSEGRPVLVVCETYKFSDRAFLDSVGFNEIDPPEDLFRLPIHDRQIKVRPLLFSGENGDSLPPQLKICSPAYDVTPAEFVGGVVCEVGLIPVTAAPAVVREVNLQLQA